MSEKSNRILETVKILFLYLLSLILVPIVWSGVGLLPKILGIAVLILLLAGFVFFLVKTYDRKLKIKSLRLRRLYIFFWSLIGVELVISTLKYTVFSDQISGYFGVFLILYFVTLGAMIYEHVNEKKWIIFIRHIILSYPLFWFMMGMNAIHSY